MKNLLLLTFLLLGTSLIYSQRSSINSIFREANRNVIGYKGGQMYYDVAARYTAFTTDKEFREWEKNKKHKLKFINNPYAIYFYQRNDTFKIYFESNYYKRIGKFFREHEDFNEKFDNWFDMTFSITYKVSECRKYGIDYYGNREADIKKPDFNKYQNLYNISIINGRFYKHNDYVYLILSPYFGGDDKPVIIFKIAENSFVLDDDFYKINEKYICHKVYKIYD